MDNISYSLNELMITPKHVIIDDKDGRRYILNGHLAAISDNKLPDPLGYIPYDDQYDSYFDLRGELLPYPDALLILLKRNRDSTNNPSLFRVIDDVIVELQQEDEETL